MATSSGGVNVLTINLSDTYVDPDFQRPLNEKFVDRIVANFDEKMLGVLILNDRPNKDGVRYSVTDGQQRRASLIKLGKVKAVAVIFQISAKEEAQLFNALQKERKPVSQLARHRALVYAGDTLAVRIDRITRQHGYRIQEGSINSISAIRSQAEHKWKLENYDRALDVIQHAWDDDTPQKLALEVIMGIWMFFERAGIKATKEEVIDSLFEYMPRNLVRDSKLIRAQSSDVANTGKGRIGAAGWAVAQNFNKYHKRKGVQKIGEELFTSSFRTSQGNRTRFNPAVNTGDPNANEFKGNPLSYGYEGTEG